MPQQRLLYVINDADYFCLHWLPRARAALAEFGDVHVAAPEVPALQRLSEEGFVCHPLPLSRRALNPFSESAAVVAFYRLYRRLQPAIIHNVTIKPVIYGGLAARLAGMPTVIGTVPGLGYVFLAQGWRARILRTLVKGAYRLALGSPNTRVIFENPDDLGDFEQAGLLRPEQAVLIKSAGVNIERFQPVPEPAEGPALVVLPARMLWDKGVGEFVAAAQALRESGCQARFALVGDTDAGNPAAIPRQQLQAWQDSGLIEWWGWVNDMQAVYAQAHIVCLPSAYREGVPTVLLEAAAMSRPLIATDAPGCREIVRHEQTGLRVAVRDVVSLVNALRRLLEQPELRRQYGTKGRQVVVEEFAETLVVAKTLALYRQVMA